MGCSDSSTFRYKKNDGKPEEQKSPPYEERLKEFKDSHEKFEKNILNLDIMKYLSEIEEGPASEMDKKLDALWDIEKSNFKKAGFEYDSFKKLLLQFLSLKYIEKKIGGIRDKELFNFLQELISERMFVNKFKADHKCDPMDKKDVKIVVDILKAHEGHFPRTQKCLSYLIDEHYKISQFYKDSLSDVLVYSSNIKIEALNIYLTPKLFSLDISSTKIHEMVQYNQSLYTLSLLIHPVDENGNFYSTFNMDIVMWSQLKKILQGASKNENIRAISLSMTKNYKIIVPPEISDILVEILDKDQLKGLWLGKFKFSKKGFNEMSEAIIKSKKLTFFGINSSFTQVENIKMINYILYNNNSIEFMISAGIDYTECMEVWEELCEIIKDHHKLKMLYFNPKRLKFEREYKDNEAKMGGILLKSKNV